VDFAVCGRVRNAAALLLDEVDSWPAKKQMNVEGMLEGFTRMHKRIHIDHSSIAN